GTRKRSRRRHAAPRSRRSPMRKSFVVIAVALVAAAIPSGATVVGLGSLAAAVALLAPSQAAANTAVPAGLAPPMRPQPALHGTGGGPPAGSPEGAIWKELH